MTRNDGLEAGQFKLTAGAEDPLVEDPALQIKIVSHKEEEEEGEEGIDLISFSKSDLPTSQSLSTSVIWKQIGITCVISLLHLACGATIGYTGIILPSITDPNSGDFYMNTEQASIYTSMLVSGSLFGSLICSPIAIKYGQRITLILSIPLALLGWLILYLSHAYWLHLLSRIIIGIFIAITFGSSTTYIAETVHSSLRGRSLAITDFARQSGFLAVCLVGSTSLNWRIVGLVCGLTPLVIPSVVLFLVPNSPRWLAIMGRSEKEIKRALYYFRGKHYNIEKECDGIQEDVGKASNHSTTWQQLNLLKERSIAKRFVLLAYLNFASSLTGNYAIVCYAVIIFKSANTGISAYTSTVLSSAMRVFGSLLYMAVADRFGRRPLAIVFLTLSALSTTFLGLYFYLNHISYNTSDIFWLPLVSMLFFQVFTCIALPVIRLLRSELLPNSVRSLGVNLLYFFMYVGSFLVAITYPIMAESIGPHWTFWIYSINSLMMAIVIYYYLPETKGKALEEIAKLF